MSSDIPEVPSSSRTRASRPELFMGVAELYAQRSSCLRANVGAVAVRDGRIVATGYVGAPAGMPHCFDVGCEIGSDGGCTRSVHAEANMIAWAARTGTALEGTTLWCTHLPCPTCAKLIGNAGIAAVIWKYAYRSTAGHALLNQMGVDVYNYELTSQETLETDTQS